jgi:hypothetical protein
MCTGDRPNKIWSGKPVGSSINQTILKKIPVTGNCDWNKGKNEADDTGWNNIFDKAKGSKEACPRAPKGAG